MSRSVPDSPQEVWALLQQFVDANAPRTKLRERLGAAAGTGKGRVKTMLQLADGPLSLSAIAEALQVDRPYATVLVNQLARLGLVERTEDPDDRRRKLVTLTAEGRTAVERANEVVSTPPRPLAELPPADLRRLGKLLTRLLTDDAGAP